MTMRRRRDSAELRIIGGAYRGRKIKAVAGMGTRPLLAQVREAIFNVLGPELRAAVIWDLFAGTGASGIEALSRGAQHVTFVERSHKALVVLQENLSFLEADDEGLRPYVVVRSDAWQPEELLPAGARGPDLIFFDPPYADVLAEPLHVLRAVSAIAGLLAPGGALVFHFPKACYQALDFAEFARVDLRTWGSSAVAFLRHRP